MLFSKTCQYAIKAVIYIYSQNETENKVGAKEVCQAIDLSTPFVAKILQELVKKELLISVKGPGGGFFIKHKSLNLYDVVVAVDGKSNFEICGLGLSECNASSPCPIHYTYKEIRNNSLEMLKNTSIHTLVKSLHKGDSVLSSIIK